MSWNLAYRPLTGTLSIFSARAFVRCAALVAMFLLTGCGSDLASVSGTLTLDGKPLARTENTNVTIMFYPESGSGAPAAAMTDESGQYELTTGSQQGVAPGKYVVTLSASQFDPPSPEGGPPGRRFLTPVRYASPGESELRADVEPGSNTFDFDLKSSS
jgi:hypothetical protein